MVKLFIGNLPDGNLVSNDDIRPLFEAHGAVSECEVIKNYGYVLILNNVLFFLIFFLLVLFTWTTNKTQRKQ